MWLLEALVFLTAIAAAYAAILSIRASIGESPFLFLRLLTMAQDPLPSFIALLGFDPAGRDSDRLRFDQRGIQPPHLEPGIGAADLPRRPLAGQISRRAGGAHDRPVLAVALDDRSRAVAPRFAAEYRRNGAHAGVSRRDDCVWRGLAGCGLSLFRGFPRARHRGARRSRRMAPVLAVLVGRHPPSRDIDRRSAGRDLRPEPRLSAHRSSARPDLAEHALRGNRPGIAPAGDPRPRPGAL